ncbi:MAG: translation elongation factor 4 [Patescibacteria group bacterium]
MNHIRNFCIIAHIDHGKSTLADRLLEVTGTVEARKMRPQYLDRLELERERGITIKMAPVRMAYTLNFTPYILNLIDTPGHSDFSYEVSRALAAVEGAILLVDATKGIQAQTLSNFRQAQKAGLKIIGAVNKIDMNPPQLEKVVESLSMLLKIPASEIFRVSGKTGQGVLELLEAIIDQIPPPVSVNPRLSQHSSALVFDSLYDDHKGILAFIRNFGGSFHTGEEVYLLTNKTKVKFKEIGYFSPELTPSKEILSGEMGYLATGIKESDLIRIGDTVSSDSKAHPLPGYREPRPVVFISFYPTASSKFEDMKNALGKLKLTDSALSIEPEANDALGRGLKIGFLGQLHFEIISSRLSQEFGIEFITSFPSVAYRIRQLAEKRDYIIKQPQDFPAKPDKVFQPMIKVEILSPAEYLSQIVNLKKVFDLEVTEIQNLGENIIVLGKMPLSELIRDFDDQLKSVSQGFASFSYELINDEEAEVEKLEIIVAGDVVPALTRIVAKKDLEKEARKSAEKLKELLPKQQFTQAIQATSGGRIVARETIPAMKKLLGNFGKTGGDRTRKMKLWKKQQRGKARLKETGRVEVPVSVFREILKK